MENPTPEPETTPLPAAEPPEAVTDPLALLAQAAKAARLTPADEERAVTLLKERLTGGRAAITAAVDLMTDGLPWVVCVNAVSAVWEPLSLPMRRHLLASIAKTETEPARRLRLSLARALFKVEPAAGLKLAAVAVAALKDPETGALSSKHRQYFFNIFIGKGKPWLLQLPLADLKPGEADTLVHAALETFSFCPPLSQLSILRWAHGAGRFKKISADDLAAAAKGISRWNVKLQRQLKAEIPELPPALEAVLKPEASQPAPAPEKPNREPQKAPAPQESAEKTAEAEPVPHEAETTPAAPAEELVIPGRAERLAQKAEEKRKRLEPERRKGEPEARRPERGEREPKSFDAKDALRGLESYIANLKAEAEHAKAQLRHQEKDERRGSRSVRAAEVPPPAEVEALTRHNARLEATVTELRTQLEDLANYHEAVAESRLLHTGEPLADGGAEPLKSLLAIKLQEAFETYHAMRLEPLDKVFRLDYRDLLGSVFDVLLTEGVPLKKS